MTETRQDVLPGLAPPPDAQTNVLLGEGRSVGQVVARAFFRPIITRLAVGYILLLLVLAVIVPFIANGRPYAIWVNAGADMAGHWEFPLFRALDYIDLIALLIGGAGMGFFLLRNRLARTPLPPRTLMLGVALLGVLAAGIWWLTGVQAYSLRTWIMGVSALLLLVPLVQLLLARLPLARFLLPAASLILAIQLGVHCYRSWDVSPLAGAVVAASAILMGVGLWLAEERVVRALTRVASVPRIVPAGYWGRILVSVGVATLLIALLLLGKNWRVDGNDLLLLLTALALVAQTTWAARHAEGHGWLVWAACLLAALQIIALYRAEERQLSEYVLALAGAGAAYGTVYRFLTDLDARRWAWLLAIIGVVAIGCLALAWFKHDYLDPNGYRDYQAMVEAGTHARPIYAPLPWDYKDQEPLDQARIYEGFSHDHWLGTDGNGRDVLARLLWSTRIVMSIGFIAVIISTIIGVIYGAFMGYFVGWVDLLGMRFVEIVDAVPTLFLIIIFVAIYGRQIFIIMVILGVTSWTGVARFVRAEFLRIRKLDYVAAALAGGLPLRSVLFRHILPNGLTPVIVNTTFAVAGTVTVESTLSYLGLGIAPPNPSWGLILNEAGNPAQEFHMLMAVASGGLIFLTTFAYFIVGETLRDALDPRLNREIA